MSIRATSEENEGLILSEFAVLSKNSEGRRREEPLCPVRTAFQRDRDRIIHSKAFRRLKHKTQVFISPAGDHYRTRLTHTLEVSQIARTISRALRLNEDLTEAIALGHDLGHTPFGHAGESALAKLFPDLGFSHNLHSLRVVDILEKDGQGLNLTNEVRDGIACHTGESFPKTLEGAVVRLSDRIAYINHDIDDSLRAGVIHVEDIPKGAQTLLGDTNSKRINTLVIDVIIQSMNRGEIRQTPEIGAAMTQLREFLFEHVYRNPVAKSEESKISDMFTGLYTRMMQDVTLLSPELAEIAKREGMRTAVRDMIAGMTDRYAVEVYERLFVPKGFSYF